MAKRKRTLKKKTFAKRRRVASRHPPPRGIQQQLFPNKKRVQHRYVETVTIDPAATGILAKNTWGANTMYDINITGAGHQPLLFDDMMTYYQAATVIGAKITAWFQPTATTTATVPYAVGIWLDQDGTQAFPTTFEHLREMGPTKMKTITFGTGRNAAVVTNTFSTKKSKSVTNSLDEPALANTSSANPTNKAQFHVFCGPIDGSTDMGPVQVTVQIDQVAIWTKPKIVALS